MNASEPLVRDVEAVLWAARALRDATRFGDPATPLLTANLDAAAQAAVCAGDGPGVLRLLAMVAVITAHGSDASDATSPGVLKALTTAARGL